MVIVMKTAFNVFYWIAMVTLTLLGCVLVCGAVEGAPYLF